jgi:hypothetical protein
MSRYFPVKEKSNSLGGNFQAEKIEMKKVVFFF